MNEKEGKIINFNQSNGRGTIMTGDNNKIEFYTWNLFPNLLNVYY